MVLIYAKRVDAELSLGAVDAAMLRLSPWSYTTRNSLSTSSRVCSHQDNLYANRNQLVWIFSAGMASERNKARRERGKKWSKEKKKKTKRKITCHFNLEREIYNTNANTQRNPMRLLYWIIHYKSIECRTSMWPKQLLLLFTAHWPLYDYVLLFQLAEPYIYMAGKYLHTNFRQTIWLFVRKNNRSTRQHGF